MIIAEVMGELVGSQDRSLSDCIYMPYILIYAVGLEGGVDFMLPGVSVKVACLVVSVDFDYCGSYR